MLSCFRCKVCRVPAAGMSQEPRCTCRQQATRHVNTQDEEATAASASGMNRLSVNGAAHEWQVHAYVSGLHWHPLHDTLSLVTN